MSTATPHEQLAFSPPPAREILIPKQDLDQYAGPIERNPGIRLSPIDAITFAPLRIARSRFGNAVFDKTGIHQDAQENLIRKTAYGVALWLSLKGLLPAANKTFGPEAIGIQRLTDQNAASTTYLLSSEKIELNGEPRSPAYIFATDIINMANYPNPQRQAIVFTSPETWSNTELQFYLSGLVSLIDSLGSVEGRQSLKNVISRNTTIPYLSQQRIYGVDKYSEFVSTSSGPAIETFKNYLTTVLDYAPQEAQMVIDTYQAAREKKPASLSKAKTEINEYAKSQGIEAKIP